jgi:hypothetical protein
MEYKALPSEKGKYKVILLTSSSRLHRGGKRISASPGNCQTYMRC